MKEEEKRDPQSSSMFAQPVARPNIAAEATNRASITSDYDEGKKAYLSLNSLYN